MSTESGKTCATCQWIVIDEVCQIILCAKHDGSMAEKLAEALREMITHHDRGYGPLTRGMRNRFDTILKERLQILREDTFHHHPDDVEQIVALQAQVEELHSSRNHLFGTVNELRVRDANALTVIEQLRSEVKTLRNQDVMLSEQNTKLREALAEIAGACLSFVDSTGVPISDEAREQLRKALEVK